MVGDSTFDVEAARRMGAPCVAVRTGGFGVDELREAGAVLVAADPRELLGADWDRLAERRGAAGAVSHGAGPAPSQLSDSEAKMSG